MKALLSILGIILVIAVLLAGYALMHQPYGKIIHDSSDACQLLHGDRVLFIVCLISTGVLIFLTIILAAWNKHDARP